MGLFEHFPYTNLQDLNLDWVLQTVRDCEQKVAEMDIIVNHLDVDVEAKVKEYINELIADGTIGDLINDVLLADINDDIDALQSDLGAIAPLDAVPTDGSTKGVTSDGVFDAIKTVRDDLDSVYPLDAAPTNGSTKGVTSDGVYQAIDAVSDDLADLETSVQNTINVIAGNMSLIPGKNIVFIGDSLTVGSGATNPATERYSAIVAKKFGMVEKNFGVGGAGFTRPNTFISQLITANNVLTAEEKANTTAVVICGGANDFRYASDTTRQTFLDNVDATFIYARTVFPDAVIYSAIANGILDSYSDTDRYWADLANDNLLKMSDYGRIFVIKNVADCVNGRASIFVSDGLHLTTEGHALFGGFIANAMMGGSTNTEYYVGTYSFDSDYVSATPIIPHIFRYNNFILFGQGQITLAQNISTNTQIGTYTGPYEYTNMYLDFFHSNVRKGSFGIGSTGAVRIIPDSGVTLTAGMTLTLRDYVGVFRKYIPPA